MTTVPAALIAAPVVLTAWFLISSRNLGDTDRKRLVPSAEPRAPRPTPEEEDLARNLRMCFWLGFFLLLFGVLVGVLVAKDKEKGVVAALKGFLSMAAVGSALFVALQLAGAFLNVR